MYSGIESNTIIYTDSVAKDCVSLSTLIIFLNHSSVISEEGNGWSQNNNQHPERTCNFLEVIDLIYF